MHISTQSQIVERKLSTMRKPITVLQYVYLYKCDHCGQQLACYRYDGEGKPTALYCVCQQMVTIE